MKKAGKIYLICLISLIGTGPIFSQRWDTVGPRMNTLYNFETDVLYADSNYLYMAGEFKMINGMHMQGIARWNGIRWDSMGAGIDGLIPIYDSNPNVNPEHTYAMATYHNKLYVGGEFSSVGYLNAPGIGTWNGTAWDTIPVQPFKNESYMGSTGTVLALTVINNKLYMGGDFDTVAGKPCIGIACWNDTNWSSLNFPNLSLFSYIDAICEYKGSIYVGGLFDGTYNGTVENILRWDSVGWHSMGIIRGSLADVWSMAVYDGSLYVGGEFTTSDGNAGNNIEKWDGTSWSEVSGGTNHQVENLLVYNSKLYAMGVFTEAGGVPADGIAEWDGSKWCSIDSIATDNADPTTAAIYKDSLYVGDVFTIDGYNTPFIAEWVGGNYTYDCEVTTGVDEVKNNMEQVSAYPNPSNGQFTLQSPVNSGQLTVYNVLGQQVYSNLFTIHNSQFTINLSGQPNGVYLYRVISENGELVGKGKVVVEK